MIVLLCNGNEFEDGTMFDGAPLMRNIEVVVKIVADPPGTLLVTKRVVLDIAAGSLVNERSETNGELMMELLIAGPSGPTGLDDKPGPWLGGEDVDIPIVFVSRTVVEVAILGIRGVVETMKDE